jgi:phage gpG-like protein
MGTTFKSITEGAFNSVGASYRPTPWKPKWDGSPSNLQASTTMAKSFNLEVSSTFARLSNPMPYARIHQLGGVIKAKGGGKLAFPGAGGKMVFRKQVTIPARPFYPILNGQLTPMAETKILAAGKRVIDKQGGAA